MLEEMYLKQFKKEGLEQAISCIKLEEFQDEHQDSLMENLENKCGKSLVLLLMKEFGLN